MGQKVGTNSESNQLSIKKEHHHKWFADLISVVARSSHLSIFNTKIINEKLEKKFQEFLKATEHCNFIKTQKSVKATHY